MSLTFTDPPRSTALTTLARMRRELRMRDSDTSKDRIIMDLVDEVSADVITFLRQPLIRAAVTEKQFGYGRTVQMLTLTPLLDVSEVRYRDVALNPSGYSIYNQDAGFLYRQDRWDDTQPVDQWIEANPVNMPGEPAWAFDYIGGYLLPGDDVISDRTSSVVASSGLFVLSGNDRFPLLVSGEYIRVTGFAVSANCGRFKVLRRTPTSLQVEATLEDATASGVVVYACRTLPFEIEAAAVNEIKLRYYRANRDPSLASEKIGDWAATYRDPAGEFMRGVADPAMYGGLEPTTGARLMRYQRMDP